MADAKYLGEWQLIPELSIYQLNEPPVSGRYCIRLEGEVIAFDIYWSDRAGQTFELHFGGPLDGERHEDDSPGVSHVMYRHVDSLILDSVAYNGDAVVLNARRIAAQDGALLAVAQTFPAAGELTNFQVYRRLAEAVE